MAGRPLAVLFVTVFLDLVGFGIVIPLLPLYAVRFGAGPITVTLLLAVYSLMQFCFAPWWGQLSDRVGRRPVLLVGILGSAASYLLAGVAGSLTMLFVARILAGAMGANVGVAQAYVADVTPSEDRARGMGLIGAAFGLGFIFGPALGGMLSAYGESVPFLAAGALALANGLLALRWLPESRRPDGRPAEVQAGLAARWRALRTLRGNSLPRTLFGSLFLLTLAFSLLEATLALWADRRWSLSPSGVAYLFAYLGVLATLVQGFVVGPLGRRLGERGLAAVGMASLAAGLLALPAAPSLPFLGGALALVAFGQGAAMPAVAALISRSGPAPERGRLLGLSQSLSALGRVIGPIIGGVAFARIGIGAPYLSGAALTAVAFAWFLARGRARLVEAG